VLVLGREMLRLWDQGVAGWLPRPPTGPADGPTPSLDTEVDVALRGGDVR
jgi:hypothetical protein